MDRYQYGLSWCPDKDVTFPIKLLIEFLLAKSYFYLYFGILIVSHNKPDF